MVQSLAKPVTYELCCCRGDYGIDVGRNIIHGSDGIEVRRPAPAFPPDPVLRSQAGSIVKHPATRHVKACLFSLAIKAYMHKCDWLALQSAQKEIALWFKAEELADYNVMTKAAIYE